MVLQLTGPISLNDIKGEFGGTEPDGIEEYYRNGDLVTGNNILVPECDTADCEVNFEQYYGGESLIAVVIDVDILVVGVDLSTYFTAIEWASNVEKVVIINSGITVSSQFFSVAAVRSGFQVDGQDMQGVLRLINNGFIYGGGGVGGTLSVGTKGGAGIHARVPMLIENNGRIYAGGAGGGRGGEGAGVYYYPDTVNWQYSSVNQLEFTLWGTSSTIVGLFYNISLPIVEINEFPENGYYTLPSFLDPTPSDTVIYSTDYKYERGPIRPPVLSYTNTYELKRSLIDPVVGGLGGSGGNGKGYNQAATLGTIGDINLGGTRGGTGADGGQDWGAAASAPQGDTGDEADLLYHVEESPPVIGANSGAAGAYIDGNLLVVFNPLGDVKGIAIP